MTIFFLYPRNSEARLKLTKINLTCCSIAILTCTFCLTALGGCSNDSRENSGDEITAKAEPVNFEDIKTQINESLKFREQVLAKFDSESKEQNRKFLVDRAKQAQLAVHLRSSVEAVQDHIEFVRNAQKFSDRFTVLSVEERMEVAKRAESILSKSDESALKTALETAIEEEKQIEETRELRSSSRYEEKKKMKAEANDEHPEFHTAFRPLVKTRTPEKFGFELDEVKGRFSESMVNFYYKNETDKTLWLSFSIQIEPTDYVNADRIKKREHYLAVVDSPKQMVLETGRLFISMKTDADFKEGDLWECFQAITDQKHMKKLADELK